MKELTLEATLEGVRAVTEFIDAQLEALDCPMKAQMQIDVAIDELFSNIARYAYAGGRGEATVRFEFDKAARTAVLTFIDSGVPYDPLTHEDPDVTLSAEERGIGGLGIFLVKRTMNDVAYRRENGRNVLTIRKAI